MGSVPLGSWSLVDCRIPVSPEAAGLGFQRPSDHPNKYNLKRLYNNSFENVVFSSITDRPIDDWDCLGYNETMRTYEREEVTDENANKTTGWS